MKEQALFVLFWASMTLAGCGSPPLTPGTHPAAPDLTGNWQVETNLVSYAVPPAALLFLAELQSTGNQVTGTVRFTNLSEPTVCGLNQVLALTGAIDSNNNLTLTSTALPNGSTIKVLLAITRSQQPYAGTGTMEVDGTTCAFAATSAIGEQIENTTGTYTGTISPGTLGSPALGTSGTASLSVAQSSSPAADGQFAATGSFSYAIGTCSGTIPLSGTVSGVGLILSGSDGASPYPQTLSIVATSNPAATSISAGFLDFVPAPCSPTPQSGADYFGTLNRQ